MKTGRPVEIPGADYKDKGTYIRPGPLGGHNWQAMSFSPKTGLVYLPAQDNGRYYEQPKTMAEFKQMQGDPVKAPLPYNLGVGSIDRNAEALRGSVQGPTARVGSGRAQTAMDGRVRRVLERRHARDRGQSRVPGHRRRRLHRLQRGDRREAVVVVGDDGHRRAADHLLDRRQAVCVGDGGMGRRVFEEARELRPPADVCDRRDRIAAVAAAAAHRDGDREQRARRSRSLPARSLYATYCVRCHGGATILPDLRRSTPAVLAGLEKILDGALVERGMPRFGELDKPAIAELRAYLLDERRKLAAGGQ